MADSRVSAASKLAKCRHYLRIFITHLFSHVGLCGLVVGYAIVGALTFESLEAPNELSQRSTIQNHREECLQDLWNITLNLNVLYEENWTALIGARLKLFEQEVVNAVKNDGYDGKEASDSELQWSFSGALLYCITVITTIGYGNIAPKTDVGKVATILYALLGIPLMLLCLTNIGDLLARSFKFAYSQFRFLFRSSDDHEHHHRQASAYSSSSHRHQQQYLQPPSPVKERPGDDKSSLSGKAVALDTHLNNSEETKGSGGLLPSSKEPPPEEVTTPILVEQHRVYVGGGGVTNTAHRVPVWAVLVLVAAYVCGGAVLFSLWEDWSFLDGAYFCFITLSTVGFGDLVPGQHILGEEGSQAKPIICCVYLVLGLAIIAMSFNLVQEEVVIKCRNLARNLGLGGDDD